MEKSIAVSKNFFKNYHTIGNSTSGYIPQRIERRDWTDICTPIFIVSLFISQKIGETQVSIVGLKDKQDVGYYSDLTRKEILPHTTTWMKSEGIMLGETSQTQKDKYCIIPLEWGTQSSQIQRQKVEGWLPWAGARENRKLFNG